MRKLEIKTGDRFNSLIVLNEELKRIKPSGQPIRIFKLKCDCGNEVISSLNNLKTNHVKSCGCLKKQRPCSVFYNTGDKLNMLTIIKEVKQKQKYKDRYFECKCDCGNIKVIALRHLRTSDNKSCGCLRKLSGIKTQFKPIHNDGDYYKNKNGYNYLYSCWSAMKQRCLNPNNKSFKRYGGRGIKIYEPWINNYQLFKEWILNNLGDRPEGYSLDRIINDGNYAPNNLRWADDFTQNNNTRRNKKNV
jgi:hypothetical protein